MSAEQEMVRRKGLLKIAVELKIGSRCRSKRYPAF